MGSTFDLSPEEICELVKSRDVGDNALREKYGGVNGMMEKLKVDFKAGLSEGEIEARHAHFGMNVLPEKPPTPFWRFWFEALQDKTLIILMIAAVVSIVLGVAVPPPGDSRETGWIEGTAIIIAVALVSGVTSGNDWSKDRKFRQLSEAFDSTKKIKVVRDGEAKEVFVPDLAVGDIVKIQSGDDIPADMLLVEQESLNVNESAMTGEPEAVHKGEEDPWLLSNTLVTNGVGKGVVIAVGPHSQWGKIKATLDKEEVETPLQVKLGDMAENIGKLGVIAASLTFVALILKWTIQDYGIDKIAWKWNHLGRLVQFIIIAVTIIVVAVPEGLPLAVTLALAYSMIKMMRDNNLVRHLAACETMGGATQICSDKTGTLTENKMTVVKLRVGNSQFDNLKHEHDTSKINDSVLKALTDGIGINSESNLLQKEGKEIFSGLATECALLVMSRTFGSNYQQVRESLEKTRSWPFSSKKKRMSTLIKTDNGYRLYCKGASEVVLELCDEFIDEKGNKQNIAPVKEELQQLIETWASEGLRTLSLTYKDLPADTQIPKEEQKKKKKAEGEEAEENQNDGCPFEENLTLIGIVGIEDPIRKEVPNSVATCQRAGITVRMLTGDNILTAKKIAKTAGILTETGIAIEGPKFRTLSKGEIDELIPNLQVIARCSPEDKLILVSRLRELGEVVAVTGDGTNDAPILREADVGFAMGISGTAVAKDASDIVLLDDNFSSIEKAVLWGRNVYDSIRKFLQFQLTVNIVAVLVAFIGAVTTGESPLKAVQLLWVNLIMDTMAALALATESPSPELMDRPPHGRYSPLITNTMWKSIIGQAIFQLFVLLFTLYGAQTVAMLDVYGNSVLDHENLDRIKEEDFTRSTIVFNTFVLCQLANEINARVLSDDFNVFKNIHKNYIFLGILVFSIGVQILIVEFGKTFAKTEPLDAIQWIFCVLIALLSIPLATLLKLIPVPVDKVVKKEDIKDSLVIEMDDKPRSAQENWKMARDAVLGQRKPGIVELIRKTHNRGNVHFGRSRITRNYTFMEY